MPGARTTKPRVEALLHQVRRALNEEITLLGLAPGGEVGAAFVHRADGRQSVLSTAPDANHLREAQIALFCAQQRGLPVPRYEDIVEIDDAAVILQQRLPGRPPEEPDDPLILQMLSLCDRFRGVLPAQGHLCAPDLYLTSSGPGFCLHESLQSHSAASRRLLDWILRVGAEEGSVATGDDLVHSDFHPGNVLVDDAGKVTGVIDWDAAGRGDARLAFTTLLFDLDHGRRYSKRYHKLSNAIVEQVRDRVDAVEIGRRRMFWAHMSLRQVDWSIRFHAADQIDHYLQYAVDGIDRHNVA